LLKLQCYAEKQSLTVNIGASTLFVGQQKEHMVCKNLTPAVTQGFANKTFGNPT